MDQTGYALAFKMTVSNLVRLVILSIILCLDTVRSIHIIGVPIASVSHGRVLSKIGEELVRRGHQYTLVIPAWEEHYFKHHEAHNSGYRVKGHQTRLNEEDFEAIWIDNMNGNWDLTDAERFYWNTCKDLLSNEEYIRSLGKVDFILCDVARMCCPILAEMLKIKRVDISPAGLFVPMLPFMHNFPSPPSIAPVAWTKFSQTMSLLERTGNSLLFLLAYSRCQSKNAKYTSLMFQYAKNSSYKSFHELVRSSGLLLIPRDFAFEYPRPLGAHVIMVGAIIPGPPRQLPSNIQSAVLATDSDIVLMSFGTLIKNFSDSFVSSLASGLAQAPALVIWKYVGKTPSQLGNNTVIYPWIPQNDLLAHPKVKAFVTHGGIHSLQEAAYHGVPVVVIPLFGDQFANAVKVKEAGFAEVLDWNTLTPGDLAGAVHKVMTNKSYKENADRVSRRMRPPGCAEPAGRSAVCACSPTQVAANWIEYGVQTEGALHMRSEADHLSFVQYYLIDVIAVLVCAFAVFVILVIFSVRTAFRGLRALYRAKFKQD